MIAQTGADYQANLARRSRANVSTRFAPRLKQAYIMAFLGQLNQQDQAASLCQLEFKNSGDDPRVTMAIKAGKAGGFFLR